MSESPPGAAYKVFSYALPYLGHMPGMMQGDVSHVFDTVNVFPFRQGPPQP
jgi:hypothetical protein